MLTLCFLLRFVHCHQQKHTRTHTEWTDSKQNNVNTIKIGTEEMRKERLKM